MKIVDARTTIVGTPWRELTFLELQTDEGLVGTSEVRMVNGTPQLVVGEHTVPLSQVTRVRGTS